jgi:hypothetical protein
MPGAKKMLSGELCLISQELSGAIALPISTKSCQVDQLSVASNRKSAKIEQGLARR